MIDEKLLPCPFCGREAKEIKSFGDERDGYADRVTYVCMGCACSRGAVGNSGNGGYADNSKVEALALTAWNTRVQPSDGALTNEGAEPVAWTYMHKGQQPYSESLPCLVWSSESIDIMRQGLKTGDHVHYHPRPDLYDWRPLFYGRPPAVASAETATCTCPSGDGSLRWPCPVHPPEVKALVLPERKRIDPYSYDQSANSNAEGWNACLDRVKELNS